MAKKASLLLLLFVFLLIVCSSDYTYIIAKVSWRAGVSHSFDPVPSLLTGTLVGFSYNGRGHSTATSTTARTVSFLKQNKVTPSHIRLFVSDFRILNTLSNSGISVDFYLNKSLVENFSSSKSFAASWLKTHLIEFLPQVNMKSIIASCGIDCLGQTEMPVLVSTLKSIHSVLCTFRLDGEVRVSVAFPLSFLEKLNRSHEKELHSILSFIKEIGSFIVIEDAINGELSMGDQFIQSMIERTTHVASILPCNDVPVVLTIKSSAVPSAIEVAQFSYKLSNSIETNTQITGRIAELYAEVYSVEGFAQRELEREEEQIFYLCSCTPVINPLTPPATTNAPAIPGQSWCVAKTGASQTALQSALDYACGMGGADCSPIQQGGSCSNPNSLQNHASYAFNSYYQKNPAPTSCDFGGTATVVNTNPSSGSCTYPSSSSTTPTPTTSTASGAGLSGSGTPPSVLNSSSPTSDTTSGFGFDSPPVVNGTTSAAAGMQPFIGCIILVTSFVSGKFSMDL
ncbi:Glucan endo-1,3-beta-glucosidase 1 [Quillaja saponaria]|uniref:glucan endo-1,3-beta-D-glucosidase n=1 Tax=Quillaja saponaria TaxID=32244 RepID=A0AAD7Q1M7_QUISA|nr:Glucan endo-1,3-beta-glucosidase 1 [Quillaja saponaria]